MSSLKVRRQIRRSTLAGIIFALSIAFPAELFCAVKSQNDSCFFKYLLEIDSSIVFVHSHIPKEAFPLFSIENDTLKKVVYWASFDEEYIIGISQNVFEKGGYAGSCALLVYSKKQNKLLVFSHYNEEPIFCRYYVSLVDILPFSKTCDVFDCNFNCIGNVRFQFYLKENKSTYEIRRKSNGLEYSLNKHFVGLDKYNQAVHLLIYYDEFKKFVDLILDFPNSIPNSKSEIWKETEGTTYYEKVITKSIKNKRKTNWCH